MEKRTEVKTYTVNKICPECRNGCLKATGEAFLTHPPTYHHECDNLKCSYTENINGKQYPYVEYEEVKNPK